MSKESEIVENYLKEIRSTKKINDEELKVRKERKKKKDKKLDEIYGEIKNKHMEEFERLGIFDLFRNIAESKIIIQGNDYKWMGAIEKATYTFDRHVKKISLLFDKHKGGRHDESELGHRINISLPFKNGINIHGFEDGERIIRERIEFAGKNNEEIKAEIALTTARFIGELQGYSSLVSKRTSLDKVEHSQP